MLKAKKPEKRGVKINKQIKQKEINNKEQKLIKLKIKTVWNVNLIKFWFLEKIKKIVYSSD